MTQEKISVDLFLTDSAATQIFLMKQNDFTLTNQDFRISIKGKGCHGFDYACGFTTRTEQDIIFELPFQHNSIHVIMDTFTAHYCPRMKIDYLLNTETNEEGFVLENPQQEQYVGKFYKSSTFVPPPTQL